jgi:membrane fusion protein, copper/silver efflux system
MKSSRPLVGPVLVPLALLALLSLAALGAHILHPGGLPDLLGAPATEEVYTCPMAEDAEVRSDGPGRCPKCGMDLVPISQTEHEGKKPGMTHPAPPPAPAGEAGHAGHANPPPPPPAPAPARKEKGKVLYYCPMHPAYISDKPGDCPICNMKLVPMEEGPETEAGKGGPGIEGHATIDVPLARRQLIGVTTGAVEKKDVKLPIRTVGLVEYDEKKLSAVTLKFGAWIEELHVKAAGDRVKKGQALFAVYSPDLLEAQRNYLVALEATKAQGPTAPAGVASTLDATVRSARERLLLWDLTEDQIREIEAKKEPRMRVDILSRVEGIVTERNAVQGDFVAAGMPVFRLADISTVWIDAAIYEQELPLVKPGATAKVVLPAFPGETFEYEVDFVYPYLDRDTRTVKARLDVRNPDGRLRPGMYAEATIEVDLGENLVVDREAVFDAGTRQIVFVDLGDGRLEPREIKAGRRAAGLVIVLDGLKEGEKVVTSGTFLIDSESRLKAAVMRSQGAMGGHAH